MARFRVYVEETTRLVRFKEFEADVVDEAEEAAENEDWRTWSECSRDTDARLLNDMTEVQVHGHGLGGEKVEWQNVNEEV